MIEKNILQINKKKPSNNSSLSLFQKSWQLCNPDFKYVFFNDNDCEEFIKRNASWYWNLYMRLKNANNKALFVDWFRFLYIYIEGGIYTDIDTICLKPFHLLYEKHSDKKIILGYDIDVNSYEEAKTMGRNHQRSFATHTFIAAAGHPLIKKFLDVYLDFIHFNHVDINTVPFGNNMFNDILYNEISNYLDDIGFENVKVFSNGLWIPHSGCDTIRNCSISFSTHLSYSSWINRDIIPFSRNSYGENNYNCGNCKRLLGNIQDKEQSTSYNNINKTLYSLLKYEPRYDELDIFLITKNNENYFKKIFPCIKKCLDEKLKTNWIIYENGSSDKTKKLLRSFFNTSFNDDECNEVLKYHNVTRCNCFSSFDKIVIDDYEPNENDFVNKENLNYIKRKQEEDNGIAKTGLRCEKIAWAREKLMELEIGNNHIGKGMPFPKWCLLIDSDVIFDYENTVLPLLNAARENPNGVMFCANGQCLNGNLYDFYYDTYALDYGIYLWDNNVMSYLNNKFGTSNVCTAKTAFGGVALIRKEVLNLSSWSTYCEEAKKWKGYKIYGMSEHYGFCEDVRRFGEIYIVKNSISHWLQDNSYINTDKTIPSFSELETKAIHIKKLLNNYLQL